MAAAMAGWLLLSANPIVRGRGLRTLATDVSHTHEVKKSRFVAYGARAGSTADAARFVERVAAENAKADHVCWACVCADGERAIDDGEPSGTAGRPILNAIQGEGMHETVVAVARFRNGPRLGAGGLLRAYGAAARQLVAHADGTGALETIVPTATVVIAAPAAKVGALYALAGTFSRGDDDGRLCSAAGEAFVGADVQLTFSVALGLEDELVERAREATGGGARRVR